MFSVILNYLRTREVDLKDVDLRTLRQEAEYYGIAPLVKRLILCEEMTQSTCGDVLFYGYLPPPSIPIQDSVNLAEATGVHGSRPGGSVRIPENTNEPGCSSSSNSDSPNLPTMQNFTNNGQIFNGTFGQTRPTGHSRNSSVELRKGISGSCSRSSQDLRGLANRVPPGSGHSRAASLDLRHARNSSADLNKMFRNEVGLIFGANGVFISYK